MTRTIDYYFSLHSPWAFLGHAALRDLAARQGFALAYKPVLLGELFAETGGQPLAKRHPLRQRYRVVELKRWRERRGVALNLAPRHWPYPPALADKAVIVIATAGHDPDPFISRAFAGVWQEERDLADPAVVAAIASEAGFDGAAVAAEAAAGAAAARYALNQADAIAAGVFGSPSYVLNGEVFWGQDRLDFLEDALASGRAPFTTAL